jgi:hypothetical protein
LKTARLLETKHSESSTSDPWSGQRNVISSIHVRKRELLGHWKGLPL